MDESVIKQLGLTSIRIVFLHNANVRFNVMLGHYLVYQDIHLRFSSHIIDD